MEVSGPRLWRKIVNNGRFISTWPIRTGVLIEDGRAYFGASLLPWQESYLCAVDARQGTIEGAELYVRRVEQATMEGPMAVFPGRALVSPQGRIPPQLFALRDGRPLGSLKGGGGSFVVLTKDSVFHGPGNKTGWLTASSLDSLETVASFQNGNAIVVAGDLSFILTDDALTASNYVSQQVVWSTDCDCRLALILAGDTLYAGGQDQVLAFDARDGHRIGSQTVDGKAYGLAVAQGRLLASTDTGSIHAFRVGDPANAAAAATSTQPPAAGEAAASATELSQVEAVEVTTDRLAVGPWWQFTSPDTARVRWRTRTPSPTRLTQFGQGEVVHQWVDDSVRLEHEVELQNLQRNVQYELQIEFLDQGQQRKTAKYECDTFFNYSVPQVESLRQDLGEEAMRRASQAARQILERRSLTTGLCLCLGCHEGELISALIQGSQLRVVAFDTDAGARAEVAAAPAAARDLRRACHRPPGGFTRSPADHRTSGESDRHGVIAFFRRLVGLARQRAATAGSGRHGLHRAGGSRRLSAASLARAGGRQLGSAALARAGGSGD